MDDHPRAVLLVEDDHGLSAIMTRLLESQGWAVAAVATAEEGLQALGRRAFAAILLDVTLPGMTGLEAIARFRAGSRAPILVMTGHADGELRKDAMLLGAQAFLAKPVPPQELDRALRAAAGEP